MNPDRYSRVDVDLETNGIEWLHHLQRLNVDAANKQTQHAALFISKHECQQSTDNCVKAKMGNVRWFRSLID